MDWRAKIRMRVGRLEAGGKTRGKRVLAGTLAFAASATFATGWGSATAQAQAIPEPMVAAEASEAAAETSAVAVAEIPEAELTGEQIYDRVLDNRFYSYTQESVMESGDRSSNTQKTQLKMKYLSFRDVSDRIRSKAIAKYSSPQDVRHLGYLSIKKSDGGEDQFVYRPSARRVRRINLRGEAVFGTDFSMEDVFPREIEDSTYNRIEDSEVDGTPVFVVEVFPLPEKKSEYSKFVAFIEREHYVTIRTQYWDENEVMIKQLDAAKETIQMYEGRERDGTPKNIWVPSRSRMSQLRTGTFTNLDLLTLDLDEKLRDRDFSERELTASR